MQKLKHKRRKALYWLFTSVTVVLFIGLGIVLTSVNRKVHNAVGTNEQINFQGRLLTSTGAVVPDGTYNIEFKVYQDGDGVLGGGDETLKWTETRTSGNKVVVKNGYFSVYLGSVTPFASNVDWNQDTLWLSINIGGTGSPSYDGEMSPFTRFGSTPYALNSKQLGGRTSSQFVQLAPSAVQADTSTNNSIFLNKTGASGNILQLQKNGVDVINIANNGAIVATYSSTSSTAGNEVGHQVNLTDTGAVSTGTDDSRGLSVSVTRTGGTGAGVINSYGVYGISVGDTGGVSTATGVAGIAASADVNYGVVGASLNTGSGQTEATGVYGSSASFGLTGTTASANALAGIIDLNSAGTYTTATGLLIKTATLTGGGTIGSNYGGWIQTQTVGTAAYGLRVDTATTQTLWISGNADSTTAAAGIAFGQTVGTQATLYRSANNTLRTGGTFIADTRIAINSTGSPGTVEQFRINTPNAADNSTIAIITNTGANTNKLLTLQGVAGQFAQYLSIQNSSGTTISGIDLLGSFRAPAGTTANPGFGFQAEATLGLYRVSSGVLGVTANGDVAQFSSTGQQLNGDLTFTTGATRTIKMQTSTTGAGNTLALLGATGLAAGNNAGGQVTLTGGTGGISTGLGFGGAGGAVTISGGTTDATDWQGNVGGALNLNGGTPASSVVATNATGGAVNINGGTGGAASGFASSGGAAGGAVVIAAGSGGAAGGGGNQTGGAGAAVTLTAGSGGTSIGSAANSNGGSITLQAGSAGTGGGGAAGTVGNISLQGVTGSIINIGANAAAQTVNIGNGTSTTAVSVLCGTGVCGFGNNGVAHSTIIGSVTGAAITYVQAGTAGMNIANDGVSNTVQIGNSNTAASQTINLGNNANASGISVVAIGSAQSSSATTILGGSGGISIGNGGISNTLQFGNTTGAVSQTINIGNNSTASSTNNVNIGSSIAGTVALTGPTTVTGRTSGSGNALTVSNSTSTGSIAIFQDNSTAVLTIADGGAVTLQNQTNVATAFQIKDSGSEVLLTADTTTRGAGGGNLIKIGNSTGTDTNLTILKLDSATADPTTNLAALNGGLFYDSSNNKVKVIENGTVKTLCNTTDAGCGAGGATTLQSAYAATSGNTITATDARDLILTFADTTTDPNMVINLQCVTSCSTNGRFAVQSAGTDVFTIAPTGNITATKHMALGATAAISSTSVLKIAETTTLTSGGFSGNETQLVLNAASASSITTIAGQNTTTIQGTAINYTGTQYGVTGAVNNDTTGTSTTLIGAQGFVNNRQSGSITNSAGTFGGVSNSSSGTIASAYGLASIVQNASNGTITLGIGLNISPAANGGGGTYTENYGIRVEAQTAGASDYGIRVDAADTQTLWLSGNADSTTAAAGIAFGQTVGTQANLYRSANNTLKTDSSFVSAKHLAVGSSSTLDSCIFSSCGTVTNVIHVAESTTSTGVAMGITSELQLDPSSNTSGLYVGTLNYVQSKDTNTRDFSGPIYGSFTSADILGSGAVSTVIGALTKISGDASANITNGYGLYVDSNNVTGTIASNYGAIIKAQTSGTNDYGLAIEAADTQTLWLSSNADNTTASAGIAFGSTVATQANLYRAGNNLLKTDSSFQVGSASSSADVNVFGDITKKGVKKITGLTGINDVFVYDTTRDSDAGAWTKSETSQQLSWYTETKDDGPGDACVITSDDRCDGSRFPQKAIIVTTNDAVYIFDSTDYKLFMKFTQSGGTYALGADTNNNPSGVFALNGIIYVGTNGTSGSGMYAFDFTSDRMFNYDATDRSQGDKNIANRNTAVTYATNNLTTYALNSSIVNDVHGAVISGSASAVAATTIPEHGTTFIVAATDSAASVINMTSGKTLDFADNLTDDVNQVWLTKRGVLYLTNETLAQVERYNAIDTATADSATPTDIFDETTANTPNLAKTTPTMSTSPDALQVVEQASLAGEYNTTTITSGDVLYVGHSQGLTEIHDVVTASATNIGWSKFYKTTGETALMSGTPRGMFGFNEASGDAIDDTMRANVLEAKGTPTRQINGVHGFGTRLNGSSQYYCSDANNDAACDTDADYGPALISFHVEAWFKHTAGAVSGTDTLIDHTYSTANVLGAGYRIYMNSTGTLSAGIDDDTTTPVFDDDIITTTPTYNDGQWHHVVFERVSTALTNPAQAAGIYLYVDGRSVGSDTTIAATLTLNSSAILGIGADCSVGAACGTGANFWDGDIDDVYMSMGGATSSDSLNAPAGALRRKFLEGKSAAGKPSTLITDATTATSTTLGKTGQTYVPNEFIGEMIEITGGTGAGQTRRIIANDATTFTVSPAFTVTPDTTSDYEVVPEQLYGSSDSVTSVGITDSDFLGRTRTLLVGTNQGSDGGGVTAFQGYGTSSASILYHSDAGITDDLSTSWTGTDSDDIQSVEARSGLLIIGSQSGLWMQKDDRNIDQTLDQIINDLSSIRQEMTIDGLNGVTSEFSNVGTGADLAERYSSFDDLTAGDVVSQEKNNVGSVKKTSLEYDPELLGIIATEPAITIGPQNENSHPVALAGRVPVKVIIKPGEAIKAGDRITSTTIAGFGMKATVAGRVVGTALEDLTTDKLAPCPAGVADGVKCGVITVFVNLTDFNGANIETSLADFEQGGLTLPDSILDPLAAWTDVQDESGVWKDKLQKSDKLLRYLLARKDSVQDKAQSEVLTDRLSAFEVNSVDIFAKDIVASTLTVDTLKANKIEGLEILTDKIGLLGRQIESSTTTTPSAGTTSATTTPANLPSGITFQTITVSGDLSVNGSIFANGALTVAGPVDFMNQTVFHKLATFIDKVVFNEDIEFKGRVTFNKDTAGFAVIHPTQKDVEVKFDKPYEQSPVVTVTIKNGKFVTYAYTDLKPESFKIILQDEATEDIEFSWTAVNVKDAKTVQTPVPVQP